MDEENFDILYKIVIIGDSGVGKSNILSRYVRDEFSMDTKATVGVEFGSKIISINNQQIKIQIWDTAGQEAFQAITRTYYKGATGALVVYDITRRDTFNHVTKWLDEVRANALKEIQIILIGNKKDLEDKRQVQTEEGQSLADKNGLLFLETSAKTAVNVSEAFINSAQKILEMIQKTGIDPTLPGKNVKITVDDDDEEEQKRGCC